MAIATSDELAHLSMGDAGNLLHGLLENDLIGMYVIQDGRFVYVNARLAEIFGYAAEELCPHLGPLDLTMEEDRGLVLGELDRRIFGGARSSHYFFKGRRKDGTAIDAEVFGSITRFRDQPAITGVLIDITQRRAAERALQEQLSFASQLIETIPSPVFYKDESGRYLGCNRAFEQYIGRPRADLMGRTVFDISPRQLAERYAAADQALFDHPGTQVYESSVATADGGPRAVMFHKATFHKADGSVGGLVGVILDITERKLSEEMIWRQANYDALTGLPNRRLFRDRLEQEMKGIRRNQSSLALLFIDLDRFKEVNDNLGHEIGDLLLMDAAQRIVRCVRSSDTVARLGGDEFTVIVADLADSTHAEQVAQNILRTLQQPFRIDQETVYISASIGITVHPDDAEDTDTLLKYADQAMYAAKEQGRNRFSYFTRSMQESSLERSHLGRDLHNAVAQGQLRAYFQPIVDLATGRIVKAEALLRWQHPTRGLIPPAQFIPIAEDMGLIDEIGDWIFRESAAMAKRWHVADGGQRQEPIQISVNKSPRQFVTGNGHEAWLAHLRELGLPPGCVSIEITEGVLMEGRPEVEDKLLQLRDAGVQVALDDFGTGYSAMSYLKRFDIDFLKIDQSFVRDMASNPEDQAIAEAIIVMAHRLGLKVVAEGVETPEQRDLLAAAGCDYGQGFLFSRPVPGEEFDRLLEAAGEPKLVSCSVSSPKGSG